MLTITESFFRQYWGDDCDLTDLSSYLKISAANGFAIPFLGYIELDVSAMGYAFPKMGFLVAKDPVNTPLADKKKAVPGVIGSNIFAFM